MPESKSSRQLLAALLQQASREGLGVDDLSGMFAELTPVPIRWTKILKSSRTEMFLVL